MSNDSDFWSRWTCPFCDASHQDPDNRKVTTCANGHTVYLGVADPGHQYRIAYKSAKDRRGEEGAKRAMNELFHAAFKSFNNRKVKKKHD